MKSHVVDNKSKLAFKSAVTRAKTNPIKRLFKINKKSNSFDNKLLNIYKKRNKINKVDSSVMEKIRKKRCSLSIKQNEVIDKWKNNIQI